VFAGGCVTAAIVVFCIWYEVLVPDFGRGLGPVPPLQPAVFKAPPAALATARPQQSSASSSSGGPDRAVAAPVSTAKSPRGSAGSAEAVAAPVAAAKSPRGSAGSAEAVAAPVAAAKTPRGSAGSAEAKMPPLAPKISGLGPKLGLGLRAATGRGLGPMSGLGRGPPIAGPPPGPPPMRARAAAFKSFWFCPDCHRELCECEVDPVILARALHQYGNTSCSCSWVVEVTIHSIVASFTQSWRHTSRFAELRLAFVGDTHGESLSCNVSHFGLLVPMRGFVADNGCRAAFRAAAAAAGVAAAAVAVLYGS
jgi:hypothetical protein